MDTVGMDTQANQEEEFVIPEGAFVVKNTLKGSHPLTRATGRAMEKAYFDYKTRLLYCWRDGALNVRVSKALVRRTLLILDAVVKGAEMIGWTPRVGEWNYSKIQIGSQTVGFRAWERTKIHATPNAPGSIPRRSYAYSPSGYLQLEIEGGRVFKDGMKIKLESKLRKFAMALYERAQASERYERWKEEQDRLNRIKEEERQRQEELEAARRREEERLAEEEEERVERLMTAMEDWRTSRRLHHFVVLCEHRLRAAGANLEGESEHARWLSWAKQHAKELDPFTNGFPLESEP